VAIDLLGQVLCNEHWHRVTDLAESELNLLQKRKPSWTRLPGWPDIVMKHRRVPSTLSS